MGKLFSYVIAAVIGLWLAALYVPGVIIRTYPTSSFFGFSLTAQWQIIIILGIALGLLNYFLRPILEIFPLPLKIISLELFIIAINIAIVWLLDAMFDELTAPWGSPWTLPLLYTTLIIWGLGIIIKLIFIRK